MMITVESDYPDDFDRVLQVLFAGVRAGKKYEDIRQVRQMFRKDRPQFDRLAGDISNAETQIQPDDRPTLASLTQTSPDDSDDEEDDGVEDSGTPVTNYSPTIGRVIDIAINRYQTSRQSDTLKTIREVVNRLEPLTQGDHLASAIADIGEGGHQGGIEGDSRMGKQALWPPG